MSARPAFWASGVLLLLIGIFLPTEWYDALPASLPPRAQLQPSTFSGIALLRIAFGLEGLLLVWLAFTGWTYRRVSQEELLGRESRVVDDADLRSESAFYLVAAVTLLGLILRIAGLNSDLWLDEITPILDYKHMTALEVIGTYFSSNNHLLNTLLMKASMAIFGEREWAVRLPAALFGAATVPVTYWVARLALTRLASLGAALLLAVSYHHIFFSQNARGYTAFLLFSLLATGWLAKGLEEDRARTWVLYITATVFNAAALLHSGFVFAAHVIVGGMAVVLITRRGRFPWGLLKRLATVFAVAAFLFLQLYALVLPRVIAVMGRTYTGASSGYAGISFEFVAELIRGISAGFGTGVLFGALPFIALAVAGFVALVRARWELATALVLPELLLGLFLLVRGYTFSPRFFLLALPLTLLCVVAALWSLAMLVARRMKRGEGTFAARLAVALVLILAVVSAASLLRYYSVPKQPYRQSIEYVEASRGSDGIVIVIHLAERGYRYYGERYGLDEGHDYFYVRTVASLDEVLAAHRDRMSLLVTTFHRALRLRYPGLDSRIRRDWAIDRVFPATVGDGEIAVWKPRDAT